VTKNETYQPILDQFASCRKKTYESGAIDVTPAVARHGETRRLMFDPQEPWMSSITNNLPPLALIPGATDNAVSHSQSKDSAPSVRPYSMAPTNPFGDGAPAYLRPSKTSTASGSNPSRIDKARSEPTQASGHARAKRNSDACKKDDYWQHEKRGDTHTDEDGTVVTRTPIKSSIGIRDDYSKYGLNEFLSQLGAALQNPFGDLAQQIVTVNGGSPEEIRKARDIGSQITSLVAAGTEGKTAVLQILGNAIVDLQSTAKKRPLTIDDLQGLSQSIRDVKV
jgi:hypothetical protein